MCKFFDGNLRQHSIDGKLEIIPTTNTPKKDNATTFFANKAEEVSYATSKPAAPTRLSAPGGRE